MDNPTYDEAVYMVRIKRRRAKEAMAQVVERYGVISNDPAPGLEVLLDYFLNMVYGLELLLKVLAGDWDTPGKTRFGHKVGKMYETVFGRAHPDPAFMRELEDAIVDQKFLCEPARGLMGRVEALEGLWDELKAEYSKRSWGKTYQVNVEVKADPAFGQYLLRNVDRFVRPTVYRHNPMTTQQKIAMKRMQIDFLNREIICLETEGEPPESSEFDRFRQLQEEHREKVKALTDTMATQFGVWGTSEIEFGINAGGVAWADLG